MHFTREPIIESILSARDGFKLVLKNSKTSSATEISTEVIEIVSFAGAVFYRSQDRSKNFMVPAADFEIVELKDARLVLKNISLEKSAKLQNPPKESGSCESEADFCEDLLNEPTEVTELAAPAGSSSQNNRLERRRERRRNRRRRHSDDKKDKSEEGVSEDAEEAVVASENGQAQVIPTIQLIPPPTTLISQTLARYKEKYPEATTGPSSHESSQEAPLQVPLEPEDLV